MIVMTWHISYTIYPLPYSPGKDMCNRCVSVFAVEVFDGFFECFYASIIRADFDFITKFHFNLVTWHRQQQQEKTEPSTTIEHT